MEKARIAIQENGGGLYGIEEAVVAVTIWRKPEEKRWDMYSEPKSSKLRSMA